MFVRSWTTRSTQTMMKAIKALQTPFYGAIGSEPVYAYKTRGDTTAIVTFKKRADGTLDMTREYVPAASVVRMAAPTPEQLDMYRRAAEFVGDAKKPVETAVAAVASQTSATSCIGRMPTWMKPTIELDQVIKEAVSAEPLAFNQQMQRDASEAVDMENMFLCSMPMFKLRELLDRESGVPCATTADVVETKKMLYKGSPVKTTVAFWCQCAPLSLDEVKTGQVYVDEYTVYESDGQAFVPAYKNFVRAFYVENMLAEKYPKLRDKRCVYLLDCRGSVRKRMTYKMDMEGWMPSTAHSEILTLPPDVTTQLQKERMEAVSIKEDIGAETDDV